MDRILKELQLDVKNITQPNSQLFGSIQNPAESNLEMLKQQHIDLSYKFEQLNSSVKAFSSHGDRVNEGLEIGDLCFQSRADLRVWVHDNLSKRDFPFGVFLDVYSFLARIQTGHTSVEDIATIRGMRQNLDLNKKVNLTSTFSDVLCHFQARWLR